MICTILDWGSNDLSIMKISAGSVKIQLKVATFEVKEIMQEMTANNRSKIIFENGQKTTPIVHFRYRYICTISFVTSTILSGNADVYFYSLEKQNFAKKVWKVLSVKWVSRPKTTLKQVSNTIESLICWKKVCKRKLLFFFLKLFPILAGCVKEHYKVEDCMIDHKDWRQCQEALKKLKNCIEFHHSNLHKDS